MVNNDILQHYHGYEQLLKKIDEYTSIYQKNGISQITNFIDPASQEVVSRYLTSDDYYLYGGYQQAIRKVLVIGKDKKPEEVITCLMATFNTRFNSLDNRDVKGAVYNLGIDTDKIGDFWVDDDKIYIYCRNELADYLVDYFDQIGRCSVKFEKVAHQAQQFKFESFTTTISSLRLDSVVSAIMRKSREKAKIKINSGEVNVNFHEVDDCDHLCNNDDVISLKKIGRYRIKDIQINKKSGKIILSIDKYR